MSAEFRRKPQITYKSPSVGELPSLRLTLPTADAIALPPISYVGHNDDELTMPHPSLPRYSKNPLELPLPLYHPFGHLALSLPPLDLSSLGLPVLLGSRDTTRQSANRVRRPVPKLRDSGYEEDSNIDTVPTAIVAVAVRDKPSPRRRRMAGPKRRRREMDDGDATYPAKRSKIPRISAEEHIDDEMEVDHIIAQGMEDATRHGLASDSKGRPLRSHGRVRQPASDASESISPSPGVAPSGDMPESHRNNSANINDDEILHDKHEDREEGELSDEA